MMKTSKLILLLLVFLLTVTISAQETQSMQTLFAALKENPTIKADNYALQKVLLGKKQITSNLYPNIEGFGTYNYSSEPTGLLPVPPNKLVPLVQDQSIPQPFSQDIFRVGANITMPVFVKSLYTTANKMDVLAKSVTTKNQLNLLQKEAIIVGANANLQYVDALISALDTKKKSLNKTKEIIQIKVKNGRVPESALLIIDNGINQVDATINQVKINREDAIATIQNLTNIRLENHIEMQEIYLVNQDSLLALKPIEQKLAADKLAVRSEKEKLLPAMYLLGNYNYGFAKAYNNDINIQEHYYTFGVALKIPIFNKSQYTKIKLAKLDYQTSQNEFDKAKLSLTVQAQQLNKNLFLIDNSITLSQKNIQEKEQLLTIAKKSYQMERMPIEDYLKYEDDLVLEKSKLYKTKAQQWQTLMQLAVIYGNNIENLVK